MYIFQEVIGIIAIIVIIYPSEIKCQVPSIDTCPNIQGTPQVSLTNLIGVYFELQKSTIIPSSLFPSCLAMNVYGNPLDPFVSNVGITYTDPFDRTQRVVRGTLELSKLVDANGNVLTTGSDFSLKLQDFPPSQFPSIPQLKTTTEFRLKVLSLFPVADGSVFLILYSCQDLPSLPFIPFRSETVWVFGLRGTNRLSEVGRLAVLEQLRKFSIDDTFLQNTPQTCS